MLRRCNAKTRRGTLCKRIPRAGFLRCFRHGGAPGNGRHLSENRHHSVSLAKARAAAWLRPHANNGLPGGLSRAETAARLPNGRFVPSAGPRPQRDKNIIRALTVVRMAKAKQKGDRKSGNLPAVAEPASDPATVSLADAFCQAGDQALARMQELLGVQIDVQQLADPAWLADPEHRKIAAMLLKLTGVQMNVALGIISGQLRVGKRLIEEEEKERSRQAALEELARKLQAPRE